MAQDRRGALVPTEYRSASLSPDLRDSIRLLASIFATGYLRLLAAGGHEPATPETAGTRPIRVDSAAPPSDELPAGTAGRRPRCKPV